MKSQSLTGGKSGVFSSDVSIEHDQKGIANSPLGEERRRVNSEFFPLEN